MTAVSPLKRYTGFVAFFIVISLAARARQCPLNFYVADDSNIRYTGRVDFSNPALPRFWQPGVYITLRFKGSFCDVILNDEVLWGKNQNYIEMILDGKATRLQTKGKTDTIHAAATNNKKEHTLVICKNTEANIGYLELVGVRCEALLKPIAAPERKIEYYGDSITCGTGSDQSVVACGKGVWQDQHNAYMSYGPAAARLLNAQYHLSSVSGIGLMHSCCNMDVIMPQVFDKVSMRDDTIAWDFKNYQPDVVTVCLGQNDGIQDSAAFCSNYILFMQQLRHTYPRATFLLLSSPMADDALRSFMKKTLAAVEKQLHKNGDKKIYTLIFNRSYVAGCDYHPTVAEHQLIAGQVSKKIKAIMHW